MESKSFRICILVAEHDGCVFDQPQHLCFHLLIINFPISEPMSPHYRYPEQHTGKVHPWWFIMHNCDQQQQASGKRSHLSPGNAGVPLPRQTDGRNDKVKPIEILLVDDLTHHLVIELQTQIQPAIDRGKLSAPCAGLWPSGEPAVLPISIPRYLEVGIFSQIQCSRLKNIKWWCRQ